jgi:hypothetical protein
VRQIRCSKAASPRNELETQLWRRVWWAALL